MLTVGRGMASTGSGVTRRDFLRVGGLGALGLTMVEGGRLEAAAGDRDRAVILLMLVGGPSQLETWDPKPDAPVEVRGPFGTIETAVPGVRINEHLPRLARRMDRLTLIRSLTHDAAPIHETGHQLLQTGRLCRDGGEHPHVGSVVARVRGAQMTSRRSSSSPARSATRASGSRMASRRGGSGPPSTPSTWRPTRLLPIMTPERPLTVLGSSSTTPRACRARSKDRAYVRSRATPGRLRPERRAPEVRDSFGRNTFGQSCLLASRLVESGVRLVTVNMFTTVFNQVTWDCHGARPFSTLDDYASTLLPTFDVALSALLDDLDRRGLLESTLVVATGEFGRTPRLNAAGGRDHWPGVWSAVLAGGGTRGGNVIGASDRQGGEPVDRPVAPAELVATMYRSLRIDPALKIAGTDGASYALVEGTRPISEAFA